jgi:hypothetical protein
MWPDERGFVGERASVSYGKVIIIADIGLRRSTSHIKNMLIG